MRLGCSTLLFGGHALEDALAGIARAGYAAIELAAIPGMGDHLALDQPGEHYREVARRVADHGLAIESVGGSTNLLDPDKLARFQRLLRAAAAVGAPVVTSSSGGASGDDASFEAVVATIDGLARQAASLGVRLSIKPHVGAAVFDTATARRFMGHVDRAWVGLNFDAFHLYYADEEPVASLAALAPDALTCRIRDALSKKVRPGPVENQIPGKGTLDIPALAGALARLPLPYVTLEIVGARDFPLPDVQRVIEASHAALAPYFDAQ